MSTEVSARELTQRIWDEVAGERALHPAASASLPECSRLVEDSERHYVNNRYVLDRSPVGEDRSRWRPLHRAKRKLRAKAARFVLHALARYFEDEQEFLAHLVRLQNTITVHVDRVSAEIREVEALVLAESDRLRGADTVLHDRLEARIRMLENEVDALRSADPGRQ